MDVQTAKKLVLDRCMELLGRDFCIKNSKRSVGMYDIDDKNVRLYIGIDDKPYENMKLLADEEPCEFFADVTMNLATGKIVDSEYHSKCV